MGIRALDAGVVPHDRGLQRTIRIRSSIRTTGSARWSSFSTASPSTCVWASATCRGRTRARTSATSTSSSRSGRHSSRRSSGSTSATSSRSTASRSKATTCSERTMSGPCGTAASIRGAQTGTTRTICSAATTPCSRRRARTTSHRSECSIYFRRGASRQVYLSFDLRDKLVYNYHQTPDNPERRQWSWNLQVGRTLAAERPEGAQGLLRSDLPRGEPVRTASIPGRLLVDRVRLDLRHVGGRDACV